MIQQGATNAFKQGLATGSFNFGTDSFKIALYTGAADLGPDTAAYSTTNEVVGTGYTAGGKSLTVTTQPTISGTTVFLSFGNTQWSPAAFTCRGAVIYKVGGPTVCVLDFGADKVCTTSFTIQFPGADSTNAIIRIK